MASEKQKRLQRRHRKRRERKTYLPQPSASEKTRVHRTGIDKIYHDHYKQLFFVTLALLAFSLVVIGVTYVNTGDVIYKGVSLSGGITITLPSSQTDTTQLSSVLADAFPESDFAVREISELGTQIAIVIEASGSGDSEALTQLEDDILTVLSAQGYAVQDASTEVIGSSLGRSFFRQTAKAVLIAFAFMGMIVFLYFGETKAQKALVVALTLVESLLIWFAAGIAVSLLALVIGAVLIALYVRFSIPSAAVILAAVSTILFTVAVVDLMHLRISTAGIAAFLMLIGYSVDTDILLSTRVLKRSEGTVYDRVKQAVQTGMTMECSTLAVALVALVFTQSDVIKEIMTIVFIGLAADIFFTWIQNAGILRLFLEKRGER